MVLADILFVFLLQHKASFSCRWPHPCDMGQHNQTAKGFASTCLTATGCACLFLLLSASSIIAASVRGVQPSLLSVYTSDTDNFKCLDGSKSLQRSRVNDDYCDCLDGSDEPGKLVVFELGRGAAMPTAAFDLLWDLQVHPHAAMANFIAGTEVINLCY